MHGDAQAALQWYRRACDVRPEDQVLRSTYSELAGRLGESAYQPTRVGLARLYLRNDLYAHALREWESLAQETPDLLEVQVGLAETLWRVDRPDEAQALCERILTNAPTCLKALLLLAAIHYDAGRDDEALRLALRARDLDPELRIASMLFSDRLTAGDAGLRALLNGEKTERAQRPRPNSRPLAAAQAGREVSQLVAHVAARPLSSLDLGVKMPEEFQGLFSETEFMLWGPDDETRTRMATQALEATDKYPRVKPPPKQMTAVAPEPPPPAPKVTARPIPEPPPVAPAPPCAPAGVRATSVDRTWHPFAGRRSARRHWLGELAPGARRAATGHANAGRASIATPICGGEWRDGGDQLRSASRAAVERSRGVARDVRRVGANAWW